MPRYPEYQIHSLDTHGYGRIIQTIDGKFYDGWGNTVIFTLFGKEVSINIEGVGEDSTDGGNVNVTNTNVNTNNTDLFQDLQNQITDLKNKLNQQNTQLNAQLSAASYVLSGTIVMWGGSVNGIPPGWTLCDGKVLSSSSKLRNQLIEQQNPFGGSGETLNGIEDPCVPDLRERFVVGAGGDNTGVDTPTYIVGYKGGVNKNMITLKNIPEHEHKFHTHPVFSIKYETVSDGIYTSHQVVDTLDFTSYGTWEPTQGGMFSAVPKSNDIPIKDGPGFTWKTVGNLTANYPNDPTPIENRPPYFALCYIIKL